jgi:hypothetical protein
MIAIKVRSRRHVRYFSLKVPVKPVMKIGAGTTRRLRIDAGAPTQGQG